MTINETEIEIFTTKLHGASFKRLLKIKQQRYRAQRLPKEMATNKPL